MGSAIYQTKCDNCGSNMGFYDHDYKDKRLRIACDNCDYEKIDENFTGSLVFKPRSIGYSGTMIELTKRTWEEKLFGDKKPNFKTKITYRKDEH